MGVALLDVVMVHTMMCQHYRMIVTRSRQVRKFVSDTVQALPSHSCRKILTAVLAAAVEVCSRLVFGTCYSAEENMPVVRPVNSLV